MSYLRTSLIVQLGQFALDLVVWVPPTQSRWSFCQISGWMLVVTFPDMFVQKRFNTCFDVWKSKLSLNLTVGLNLMMVLQTYFVWRRVLTLWSREPGEKHEVKLKENKRVHWCSPADFVFALTGDRPQPREPELPDRLQGLAAHHLFCKVSDNTRSSPLMCSLWCRSALLSVLLRFSSFYQVARLLKTSTLYSLFCCLFLFYHLFVPFWSDFWAEMDESSPLLLWKSVNVVL